MSLTDGSMPKQLFEAEQVVKIAQTADAIRIVKSKEGVKIKLRTPRALYTFVCREEDAGQVLEKLKDMKKEIIEV